MTSTHAPTDVLRGIGVLKGAVSDLEQGFGPVEGSLPPEVAANLPSRLETLASEYQIGGVIGEGGSGRAADNGNVS